ncbi:MAG: division/cell wall cluster transcriptional repressor MraZ [Sphingobacteriales bacterium]|nr:MAG: division/cell wall cluster transcriptional repressor MraZ [Sphingobacteriales bacterium]
MKSLIGEFDCTLDSKGRFIMPTGLRKQIPQEAGDKFVINRGFEKCLVMYPFNEWEKISEEINKLNPYVQQNRDFIRYFFRGAIELTLDASSRLLLPKRLLDYAGISKDVVLFAHTNKIEIWSEELYNNIMDSEPENFADLAEKVMGGNLHI